MTVKELTISIIMCLTVIGCGKNDDPYDVEREALEQSIKQRERDEWRKDFATKFVSDNGMVTYIPNKYILSIDLGDEDPNVVYIY
jgi:hypothetical protein